MSGYPVLLEGSRVDALIVGGGVVAERKANGLLECGATVRVVASEMSPGLRALAASGGRLSLVEREYRTGDIGPANLIFAATSSRLVNAQVAADARALARVVIVADAPDEGNCASMASHRAGAVVIGVSAGGVPTAATRIRDAIAARFDTRYAVAVNVLAALRRGYIESEGRDAWAAANAALVGADFCALVDGGEFTARVTEWSDEAVSDTGRPAWR